VAAAMLMLASTTASAATLYDQTDNESTTAENITSPGNEIADDFVVPAGASWTITGMGANIDGVGFTDMTVTFYADDGTGIKPTISGNLASRTADTSGNLASAVTLDPGHYWIGITATGILVGWPTRTVQSNSKAVADSGAGCPRWSLMQDCEVGTNPGPDMSFSITGTSAADQGSGGVGGVTGSAPSTSTKKKCKKHKHRAPSTKKCRKKKTG
jgi:hypothetical protein